MLAPGGHFVIADIVEHSDEAARRLAAETWDRVVRQQSLELAGTAEAYEFFVREGWNTFRYLDSV